MKYTSPKTTEVVVSYQGLICASGGLNNQKGGPQLAPGRKYM